MRYSSGNLFGYAWLTFTLTRLKVHAEGGVACKDQHGRSYESGFHYIPGPEPCTFCICDNGNPKLCKAFICKFLEEDCKSFRRGDACCEFICLDDTLPSISNDKSDGTGTNIMDGNANYDLGLRSVASFVTAILSMSLLFFLIHRLRQRKIQVCVAGRENRQIGEDQRSLGNMGYLERGGLLHGVPMDDIPCGTGYSLWKPPGNYFPRGEAPPPYEEAVAAARAEQALLSMNPHTLLSMNFSDNYIPSGNNHSGIAVVANTPNELTVNTQPSSNDSHINAPLMSSSSNRPLSSPGTYANYRPVSQSSTTSTGLNTSTSTTSFTMGTNMYENLPVSIGTTSFNEGSGQHSGGSALSAGGHVSAQQQPVLPISHSTIPKSYRQHTTTFPRQSGGAFTISATLSNSDVSSSHRTIPRTLTTQRVVTAGRAKDVSTDCSAKDYLRLSPGNIAPQNLHSMQLSPAAVPANYKDTKDSDVFYADVPVASASALPQPSDCVPTYTAHMTDVSEKTREFKPSLSAANEINASGSFESVACTCSMQALPTLHDDTDDYRSECENCKSATGSRYYLDNEDELVTSLHETMTLHRRPDDAASSATPQYYRTSLTLPTSTRQRTRITGARENWFSTMPESSSGSSDEN